MVTFCKFILVKKNIELEVQKAATIKVIYFLYIEYVLMLIILVYVQIYFYTLIKIFFP